MNLINCRTFQLEDYRGRSVPPYAILSHTWEDEEVTYQDFANLAVAKRKKGWSKIQQTCTLALEKYDYAWVDTCCIDKSSSADLTEAINSMFQWYEEAAICYAYISDFDTANPQAQLNKARWFTRGWTLQELIAPSEVQFFDSRWRFFGTRSSLCRDLSAITGIEESVLATRAPRKLDSLLRGIPVAKRMSWAARRQTTRKEDIAYCLLGIFAVNMPLLYGEGLRAFTRLQEGIIEGSNDLTILAWQASPPPADSDPRNDREGYRGVLATEPSEFAGASNFVPLSDLKFLPEFSMTNKGLRIQTSLHRTNSDKVMMSLNCHVIGNPAQTLGIFLKHQGGGVYVRGKPDSLGLVKSNTVASTGSVIFIAQHISSNTVETLKSAHRSAIHFDFQMDLFERITTVPADLWDTENNLFIASGIPNAAAFHLFRAQQPYAGEFVIAFGMNEGQQPWVCIDESASSLFAAAMSGDLAQVRAIGIR
ncbi:hypothetical protein BJ170DRAFT_557068, partial [Xylariales sp. AK1849]